MKQKINLTELAKLQLKIPYDEDIFVTEDNWSNILIDLFNDSTNIALETLYPYAENFDDIELPKKYYNWRLRCCVELYNLADKAGLTRYSENSISWDKLSDGLSNFLMNKLTSHVGVPKKDRD